MPNLNRTEVFPIASLQLVFDVLAKDNASGTFRQIGDSADRAGKQAESGLNRATGAAKALGGFLLGAGIIAGFNALYSAAAESQKIAARTENVIKTMGNAAGISADQVGDLAGAIAAKTGVDDEAIQSGQNLILTFGNIKNAAGEGNDIFTRTSEIMVDMSAAMGTDASGSAIQLGKALNDPIKGITALTRVGVSFTDAQKEQIRTLVETGDTMGAQKIILGELERQFGGAAEAMSTPLERAQVAIGNVAEELGGYLLPVVGTVADGLLALIEGFQTGETSADGFQGSMQTAGDVLHTVFDGLGEVAGVISDVVGFFTDLPGPVQAGIIAFGAFSALKGPVSSVFETISLKALYMKDALANAAASVGTGAAGGLRGAAGGLVGFLGGPWGIALAGATVGLGFLASALSSSDEAAQNAEDFQRDLANALQETNGVVDESIRALAAHRAAEEKVGGQSLLKWAEDLGVELPTVTDALLGNAGAQDTLTDAINARLAVLDRETAAGGSRAAAAGEERSGLLAVRDAYDSLGGSLQGAVDDNRLLAGATEQSATSMGTAFNTAETFTAGLEEASEAASDASRQTNLLKTALDILTGASVTMIEVESNYQSALADATGALKDLTGRVLDDTGALDLQSEAGRATADVLLGVRDSGNQLIATMVEQGATADQVRAAEARLRDDFIRTAGQMGITGDAANVLADQILGIPDQRITTVIADTGPAAAVIQAFKNDLAGGLALTVPQLGLGVPGRAFGGIIPGSSPNKRADNVLIRATAGEFMHDVDAVNYYGVGFMEALNRREIPRDQLATYAYGGLISPFPDPIIQPLGVTQGSLNALNAAKAAAAIAAAGGGPAGNGAIGGAWGSIWNYVKARIPEARINSTYRPGDPGYHGKNKAIDFGFGSGPGGNGSAGLASINRLLYDGIGGNLAELIYDGIGDDRPDLKNGRPLTYSAATRAEHHNHVHAAVYDRGTNYVPADGPAYLHRGEAVIPAAENQGAPYRDRPAVTFYTPDVPSTIRALRAYEHEQEVLAPAW